MASVANLIRNINLYVDGVDYAGQISSFKPPDLNLNIMEYRAGGMDAPVALDRGMELIRASFTLNSYDEEFITQWGGAHGELAEFVAKAALENYDGTVKQVIISMRGRVLSLRRNEWEGQGEVPEVTMELGCSYYKEDIGGYTAIEIDIFNFVRIVGGVDRLANIREAIQGGGAASTLGQNRIRRNASNTIARILGSL